jgi:hypothetical protein
VLAQLIRHRQRDDGTSCALTLSVSAQPTGRVAETPVSSPADNPRATLLTSTSHADMTLARDSVPCFSAKDGG